METTKSQIQASIHFEFNEFRHAHKRFMRIHWLCIETTNVLIRFIQDNRRMLLKRVFKPWWHQTFPLIRQKLQALFDSRVNLLAALTLTTNDTDERKRGCLSLAQAWLMLHTRSLSLAEFLAVEFPARDASAIVICIPVTRRGIMVLHAHQCRLRRSGGRTSVSCALIWREGKTSMSSASTWREDIDVVCVVLCVHCSRPKRRCWRFPLWIIRLFSAYSCLMNRPMMCRFC